MLIPLDPANGEPILPIADLKARIRVLHSSEDADIERMRDQAIDFIERYTGVALSRRSFQYLDKQFCRAVVVPVGPVYEVTAIAYDDSAGSEVNLTDADWRVGAGAILPAPGQRWPYSSGDPGSVRITFTAGLEDAAEQAPLLIAAVEVAVAALFDNREAPNWTAAMNLADSYRMPGL